MRVALAYMKLVKNIDVKRGVRWLVGNDLHKGNAKQWLIQQFPRQWHACRQRSLKARTLFVVFVDADKETVEHTTKRLWSSARDGGYGDQSDDDPTVLLIPRWHVETWIRALLGQSVTEDAPCKGWWGHRRRTKCGGGPEPHTTGRVKMRLRAQRTWIPFEELCLNGGRLAETGGFPVRGSLSHWA
jgi:hypothetical protein